MIAIVVNECFFGESAAWNGFTAAVSSVYLEGPQTNKFINIHPSCTGILAFWHVIIEILPDPARDLKDLAGIDASSRVDLEGSWDLEETLQSNVTFGAFRKCLQIYSQISNVKGNFNLVHSNL